MTERALTCLTLWLALGASASGQTASNGVISGTVLNAASGAAITDAHVYARSGLKRTEAAADSKGHYELRDMPAGQYSLRVYSGGMGGPHGSRVVTLVAGQELPSVDFRLQPNGVISGKVVDENREPVPELLVLLIAREYRLGALRYVFARITKTDDRGQYTVTNVVPGRGFLLLAEKRMFKLSAISDAPAEVVLRKRVTVPTWYPNTSDMAGAEVITLRPGERRVGMDIQMRRSPSYCMDGVLETPRGPGVLQFGLEEQEPTSGKSGDGGVYFAVPGGETGEDGRIRICDLHAGSYQLSVLQTPKTQSSAPLSYAATTVTIGDKDVNKVHLMSAPRLAVPGEVAWGGKPPEQLVGGKLSIVLDLTTRAPWQGEIEGLHAEAAIPGQFSFPGLALDEYSVDLQGVPNDLYVKDILYAGSSILHEPLRLGNSVGAPELRVMLGTDGGVVSARVTDRDGHPVPDCGMFISPEDASSDGALAAELISGKTDQNGAYSSAHLAPGKYVVLASMEAFDAAPESVEWLKAARNQGTEVIVGANATATVSLEPIP